MRRGFAPPHFRHLDDLFAPQIDQIYNFIQILLGPILNFEPRTPTDFYPECPPPRGFCPFPFVSGIYWYAARFLWPWHQQIKPWIADPES